jgi:hypothetical protein
MGNEIIFETREICSRCQGTKFISIDGELHPCGCTTLRKCPSCQGTEYTFTPEGKRQLCLCFEYRKAHIQFTKAFGYWESNKKLINQIKDVNSKGNLIINSMIKKESELNGILAYCWAKNNIDKKLKVLPSFQLHQIFVGSDNEFKSLRDLNFPIAVILYGYQEYPFKTGFNEVLKTVMEERRRLGLVTWFVARGGCIVPKDVHSYMDQNYYTKITVSDNPSSNLDNCGIPQKKV